MSVDKKTGWLRCHILADPRAHFSFRNVITSVADMKTPVECKPAILYAEHHKRLKWLLDVVDCLSRMDKPGQWQRINTPRMRSTLGDQGMAIASMILNRYITQITPYLEMPPISPVMFGVAMECLYKDIEQLSSLRPEQDNAKRYLAYIFNGLVDAQMELMAAKEEKDYKAMSKTIYKVLEIYTNAMEVYLRNTEEK